MKSGGNRFRSKARRGFRRFACIQLIWASSTPVFGARISTSAPGPLSIGQAGWAPLRHAQSYAMVVAGRPEMRMADDDGTDQGCPKAVRRGELRALSGRQRTASARRFLPYRLNVAASLVSQALSSIYAERYGIGVPEWRVLVTLGEFGIMTGKAIGEHSHMHKTKVSRAVALLEKRKLVRAGQPRRPSGILPFADAGRPRDL